MNPPVPHPLPARAHLKSVIKDHSIDIPSKDEEFYVLRDDHVSGIKKGVATLMEAKATLDDGSILHPNGVILWNTGEPRVLIEGEAITLDGRIFDFADWEKHWTPKKIS